MSSHRVFGFAIAVGLLAGCAGPTPTIAPTSPVNAHAEEGGAPSLSTTLNPATAAAELNPSRPGEGIPNGIDPTTSMGSMKGTTMPGMKGEKPAASGTQNMQGHMHDMPHRPGMNAAASQPATTQAAAYYTCSMHPQIHQDHPGKCPICGMKLIKKDAADDARKGGNQ